MQAEDSLQTRESPAFPAFTRRLTVGMMVVLIVMGMAQVRQLHAADWSPSGALLFGSTALLVLWMGTWIVRSRTRLDDDVLTQTWLWNKRVRVAEVASLKLVFLPWFQRVMAPRLLVRQRGGGMTWIHSADPQILLEFMARVAQRDPTKKAP